MHIIIKKIQNLLFPQTERNLLANSLSKNDLLSKAKLRNHILQTSSYTIKIHYIFNYADKDIKSAIQEIKYGEDSDLSKLFGNILFPFLSSIIEDDIIWKKEKIILSPIPLSKKSIRERGFNQSEEILRNMPKEYENFFEIRTDIIEKKKETKNQALCKGRGARLQNMRGAFNLKMVEKNLIKISSREIIIFDDVTTTGATFKNAIDPLMKAGFLKITCFALAH